jgi:inorganic triphosphatase YgiF
MTPEIELKLAVPPSALRRAARLPWLNKLAKGPVDRKKLVSVYFDTDKFELRDNGLTLRIRKVGRKRLQTIKTMDGTAGPSGRQEWEAEIASEQPDLGLARHTALAPLLTGKLKRSLRPVFETDVQRVMMPLRVGDSEVELAFDRGRIKTGRRRADISEIELELKKGDRADLARLAERLARAIPVSYGARAKSERGYALRAGEQGRAVDAGSVVLDHAASTADAFAVIGLSCLRHLAANQDAVREGEPEGVHQMRVGLRRLRAAISLFKTIVQGSETEDIKAELKWLTEQLGPARDFDVLVRKGVAPLRKASPDKPEITLLETDLKKTRAKGFDKAKAAVASERYRDLVLTTALWLINGNWLHDKAAAIAEARARSARAFARDVLDRRTGKIVKRVKKLEDFSARERHKVRIAVKKLRYATDFFGSLFAKRKARKARRRFENVLKALQDALGKLNDIAVHEKLARQFAHPRKRSSKRPQKAFAMGVLTGREQSRARACIAAAGKAGGNLSDADRFWR